MITEETQMQKFIIDYQLKTVRIIKDVVLKRDGIEMHRVPNHSESLDPGMIEQVKDRLGKRDGPEIDACNALWTPGVIEKHRRKNLTDEERKKEGEEKEDEKKERA